MRSRASVVRKSRARSPPVAIAPVGLLEALLEGFLRLRSRGRRGHEARGQTARGGGQHVGRCASRSGDATSREASCGRRESRRLSYETRRWSGSPYMQGSIRSKEWRRHTLRLLVSSMSSGLQSTASRSERTTTPVGSWAAGANHASLGGVQQLRL